MTDPTPGSTTAATDLTGGCQCGAVRYRLTAAPTLVAVCHCRMCQRAAGAPFVAFATLPAAAVAWQGEPAWFESSDIARRSFCPACGTPLAFQYLPGHPEADTLDITVATLDDPTALPPTEEAGVESRLSWLDGLGTLPRRETATDPDVRRPVRVNRQHTP